VKRIRIPALAVFALTLAALLALLSAPPTAGDARAAEEPAQPGAAPAPAAAEGQPASESDQPDPAPAAADDDDPTGTCLECHTDPDTTKTVNGKDIPLVVDPRAWKESVHAAEGCTACHVAFDPDDIPHAENLKPQACTECHDGDDVTTQVHAGTLESKGTRPTCTACHTAHAVRPAEELREDPAPCLRCHTGIPADAFAKSVHGRAEGGERNASCSECHGAHVVLAAREPEAATNPGRVPQTCGECHGDVREAYEAGLHWRGYRKGLPDAPVCSSCHDPHGVAPMDERTPQAVTAADVEQCRDCHLDAERTAAGDFRPAAGFIQAYAESVHGRPRADGRPAATCVDCHGAHGTGSPALPDSTLGRAKTAATCGRCHATALVDYEKSIHGKALAAGMIESATCTDCHGEHSILSPQDPRARASLRHLSREACGVCHGSVRLAEKYGDSLGRLETYEDTYHGLAVVGGSVRAANCAGCHGAHLILPSSDPQSSIHPDNLVETCGKCHSGATQRFARIPVHATYSKAEYPVAFTVKWVYIAAIAVIIGGMLLHNLLVWFFFVRRKWRHEKNAPGYQRWQKFEVWQHVILAVTFTLLVISGFALKFPNAWWVQPLKAIGFDEEVRRWVHRICATAMTISAFVQAGYFAFHKKGRRDIWLLLPRWADAVHFWQNMMYHLGRRPTPPRFDRFDYTEKAEYLALIWGTAVMAATGLVLWFPEVFTAWAPEWFFDVAQIVHYYEAWLATLAIIVWHGFYTILHPREYPMSTVWLNGRMPEHEWRERHPLEFERETGQPAETPGGPDEPHGGRSHS
jgi:cytochrome b subunit of formate dehydrogenase